MEAFGTVLIAVSVVAVVAAALSYWGSGRLYRDIGRESPLLKRPGPGPDVALREEVRQLVVARNERRLRQGKQPLDVESEIERQLHELGE